MSHVLNKRRAVLIETVRVRSSFVEPRAFFWAIIIN